MAPPDSATVTRISACCGLVVGGRVAMNSMDFVWPGCSGGIDKVVAGNCPMIDGVPVSVAEAF
jgi:hypothetical protein